MITIQIGGKTYQIIDLKGRIKSTIEEWISAGYLEEVKENKEPTVHIPNDGKKYMINGELYNPQANSILEKLRKELEKMKTENTDTSDEYTQGVLNTCDYLLELLIPLEQPKEEPQEHILIQNNTSETITVIPEQKGIKIACPQPQEDIELPGVPEWKAFSPDGQTYDSKDYQIEQLTKFCQAIAPIVNQLIKANKK